MRYVKDKPKIDVKFYNSETDDILVEINNRNWMNIGELFVEKCADQIMKSECKNLPRKIMVIAVAEYTLAND